MTPAGEKKKFTISEGSFGICDANDNIMFKVNGKLLSFGDCTILLDAAAGIPNLWGEMEETGGQEGQNTKLNIVRKKVMKLSTGDFGVTDDAANGKTMFKVKGKFSFHSRRTLFDAEGKPVFSIQNKIRSMHSEWYVFIGGSCKDRRYLFCTVRKPSVFESAGLGVLNVFMEPKISKDNCNYRIEYSEEMCTIYAGESDTVIAKMSRVGQAGYVIGVDEFLVTVKPDVDCAFVVALIAIVQEIQQKTTNVIFVGKIGMFGINTIPNAKSIFDLFVPTSRK